jgi:hypothetical protein
MKGKVVVTATKKIKVVEVKGTMKTFGGFEGLKGFC